MNRSIPYFDGHCDTISLCAREGRPLRKNGGHLDLERLAGYDRAAQIFAMFADRDRYPGPALERQCRKMQEVFAREAEQNRDILAFCPQGRGIARANAEGKIAALLSIEGGELLNCDPALLETATDWGVRCINVTWNHANALAGSHMDQPDRGLSDRGREWIRECARVGILADVSHLSDRAFWDILEMGLGPVVATHSNTRAVCGHSRNLTDDMFRAICQSGGTAGMNFYTGFVGGGNAMEDILRHADHLMELGGAKHLALGADLDGCDELAGGLTGVQDMPRLWDALRDHGYDEATLEDIFYHNLLRVMEG